MTCFLTICKNTKLYLQNCHVKKYLFSEELHQDKIVHVWMLLYIKARSMQESNAYIYLLRTNMLAKILLLFTFCTACQAIGRHVYSPSIQKQPLQNGVDWENSGKPLFLTPLIRKGLLSYARNLSKVGMAVSTDITSYSGYLTVNQAYGSNMFFWYFPAIVSIL